MLTQDKRSPAYEDTDKMPFGKYKDEPMSDVPASYLVWLHGELKQQGYDRKNLSDFHLWKPFVQERVKLFNYIHNSWEALQIESKE